MERRSLLARLRTRIGGMREQLEVRARDRRVNRRWIGAGPRFLVVRHAARHPGFYDVLLDWVERELPELRRLFEFRLLPCYVRDWSPYVLQVPWLQDPVEAWSPRAYARACRLAAASDRCGIPVINRVDRLKHATKVEAARRIGSVGLRTPRMRLIEDRQEFRRTRAGLRLPLFVREDAGHGGPMLKVDSDAELRALPLEQFRRPSAVEFVDVRCPEDGLYRKFRYFVAGRIGVPHHMQASEHWITRGEIRFHNAATRAQEQSYVDRPDPYHDLFQRARAALGLDWVAFDYAIDRDGAPIVWEVNPYPHLHMPRNRLAYLVPAMHRTFAAVVHLYLERAGLAVPARLSEILFGSAAVTCSGFEAAPPRIGATAS